MILALVPLVALLQPIPERGPSDRPEARAIGYLAAEVPRWRAENGCASCHHNGDGAHALYRAIALGFEVPDRATADSTRWLLRPDSWDDNGGDGTFSDKRLARIQFARALAAAVDAGVEGSRPALDRAAEVLAADQHDDGSWPLDGPDTLGTPATYGWTLATLAARDVLRAADAARHRDRIRAADAWLRARPIRTVLDASVELLRDEPDPTPEVAERRSRALDLLRRSQAADGGFGPFASSPPEAFDTALALLALSTDLSETSRRQARRARSFLIDAQLPSGGWPETTRPSGNESDAQHYSTSAWATLALLASRRIDAGQPADPFEE